jgi:hypothetical protein
LLQSTQFNFKRYLERYQSVNNYDTIRKRLGKRLMIMNREEWIDYYESINGHKPSISEVYEAEKNGDIFVISESSTPLTVESQDYISNHSPNYRKKSAWRSLWNALTFIISVLWGLVKLAFSLALFIVNIILTIFFFFVRIIGFVFLLSR